MRHPCFRKGSRVIAVLAASTGAIGLGGLASTSVAHADPPWATATKTFVAVGSNTLEDLMDAYSGTAPTPGDAATPSNYHSFTPLLDPSTFEQVYSWDAVNQATNATDCISAKPGFAPIARPNGSGDGQKALSDAIQGIAWSKAAAPSCAPQSPTGQIDIGRSSSPPSGAACTFTAPAPNCLAWVDIGRDAVAYAYFIKSGSGVTSAQVDHLSNATLTSIYTNANGKGTFTDTSSDGGNGVTFGACLPQLGSGTEKFFVNNELNGGTGLTGGTATAEAAANASACANFEENGATTFQTTAAAALTTDATDTPPPTVMVTPFSVGSWIAQSNGFAFDRSSAGITAGVAMGVDDGTAGSLPYSGSPPNEVPNTSFYDSTLYGRDLFLEVNNNLLNGRATQVNAPLRGMLGFLGTAWTTGGGPQTNANTSTGAVCKPPYATTTLNDFGFSAPQVAACGAETLTLLTTGNGS
jgi:hypothetical protein